MKNQDIQSLGVAELKDRIATEEENLKKLRFAHAVTEIENPMKLRELKRLVARLKTALTLKNKEN